MTPPRIAVLDYDAGNLRSAAKALARTGAEVTVTSDAARAVAADALVVPGVGNFGQCVRQFRAAGLEDLVRGWVDADRPLLGICVGMQILYGVSEEEPGTPGLGVLPGAVRRLPDEVIVPHTGWNVVDPVAAGDPLIAGIGGERCYFNHSYYAEPADAGHVVASCGYGPGFPCVVRVGRAVGTQFHPEKSAGVGARLLANFVSSVVREETEVTPA